MASMFMRTLTAGPPGGTLYASNSTITHPPKWMSRRAFRIGGKSTPPWPVTQKMSCDFLTRLRFLRACARTSFANVLEAEEEQAVMIASNDLGRIAPAERQVRDVCNQFHVLRLSQ